MFRPILFVCALAVALIPCSLLVLPYYGYADPGFRKAAPLFFEVFGGSTLRQQLFSSNVFLVLLPATVLPSPALQLLQVAALPDRWALHLIGAVVHGLWASIGLLAFFSMGVFSMLVAVPQVGMALVGLWNLLALVLACALAGWGVLGAVQALRREPQT